MCGRYTLTTPMEELVEVFDVPEPDFPWKPRYNIAPTQDAPVLARDRHGTRIGLLRWGLVPFWADDPRIGNRMINARAETLDRKPAFKYAFQARRCLVLADGFYEWRREGTRKQPVWIHDPEGRPLTFAGLWECWERGPEPLYTFTIVTTEPCEAVRPVHDRMPAVLDGEAREAWLDREADPERLKALLGPYRGPLDLRPVSTLVNSPANEGPELLDPAPEPGAADPVASPPADGAHGAD
ncbi:MAG: SOS response-associated peptidase, partial [Gemmatimonadetes bacterium]